MSTEELDAYAVRSDQHERAGIRAIVWMAGRPVLPMALTAGEERNLLDLSIRAGTDPLARQEIDRLAEAGHWHIPALEAGSNPMHE